MSVPYTIKSAVSTNPKHITSGHVAPLRAIAMKKIANNPEESLVNKGAVERLEKLPTLYDDVRHAIDCVRIDCRFSASAITDTNTDYYERFCMHCLDAVDEGDYRTLLRLLRMRGGIVYPEMAHEMLIMGVEACDYNIVSLLLEGVPVDTWFENLHHTALTLAIWHGHTGMVKHLVERHDATIDMTIVSDIVTTPLKMAISNDALDMVQVLLYLGADPNYAGEFGSEHLPTPLEKAKIRHTKEGILELLTEAVKAAELNL